MSRRLALSLAFGSWFCSGWALLVGVVWGLGLRCDESCGSNSGWQGDPVAWEWYGVAALGVVAFLGGGALVFSVWQRRPVAAAVAVAVGYGAVLILVGGLSAEWIHHLDRRSPGELLAMAAGVFAPILAVLLTVPARPRPVPSPDGRE
jgi:hypothetical protein